MLYIKKYIKENISMLIVLVCFLLVAVFNAFMNVGIVEDGCHHFWEALIADNIWTGHEGINSFPFNSRYFPTIIQHLSVGILILLGITNLKIILFTFTLLSYLLPVMILFVVYLNIPKEKKNCFEIMLLYFLTCMIFMMYQVWTENFLTGLFLWVIFVIYYYNDFDKLSKFNLISLILFSVCLISSHPMTAVFVVPMIIFAIIKQYKTKNISKTNKTILIVSYILLFIAFIFNLYFIFRPIYIKDDYLFFEFLDKPVFIYFSLSLILLLLVSLINTKKLKYLLTCIVAFVCFGMLNFVLLEIESSDCYTYRVLGFYVPLFLMIFILVKDFFKLIMNYNYIKVVNYVLIIIFFIHSVYFGLSWNKYLINIKDTMITNEQVNFMKLSKYGLFHFHTIPYDCVFVSALFDINPKCKISVSEKSLLYGHAKKIKKYKNYLSKFNIKVDNFITN
ncbi:MAG: hypothetical protein K5622_03575 [Endomicrobiaceae bacterium]|nr:hypothetical protein [Endomicrobiaceae bacterium]